MIENLERTHLYKWHKTHGDVVPFAGWEMPVRYTDIREEHLAVRNNVGVFDTTHMSRFSISGSEAADFLQYVTTNNVHKLNVNDGHYTTCLNQRGGILDDLMLYRVGEYDYIWVTNAANGEKIKSHLLEHSKKYDVSVRDKSKEIVMIAVQGPKALSLLSKMAGMNLTHFNRFTANPVALAGYSCILCRTGYTGEDGGEILLLDTHYNEDGIKKAISFWEEILKQGEEFGAKPCGLGARDSTRLEAGLVLYGHELNEDTSPIEARIPYAVKFKVDPHYIGYDIIYKHKKEGTIRKIRIGFKMIDRGIPRENYPIVFNNDIIGDVTSGTLSPILETGIGMGFVEPDSVNIGDVIEIDLKGRMRKAKVVDWPFYDPEKYGSTRIT